MAKDLQNDRLCALKVIKRPSLGTHSDSGDGSWDGICSGGMPLEKNRANTLSPVPESYGEDYSILSPESPNPSGISGSSSELDHLQRLDQIHNCVRIYSKKQVVRFLTICRKTKVASVLIICVLVSLLSFCGTSPTHVPHVLSPGCFFTRMNDSPFVFLHFF